VSTLRSSCERGAKFAASLGAAIQYCSPSRCTFKVGANDKSVNVNTTDPLTRSEYVEDGLGVGGLDGGGDVGDVVCEEAAGGRAALAVSRVVSGAGEARLAREEVCINMNKCYVY
jgi:hypothetical protein